MKLILAFLLGCGLLALVVGFFEFDDDEGEGKEK